MNLCGIHKSYGDKKVYEDMEFQVRRGDRVALAGPNGAGKSTLLRILAGDPRDFDAGERSPGAQRPGRLLRPAPARGPAPPEHRVGGAQPAGASLEDTGRLRGHLGAFLFSGDDVEKPIAVLSGGEKARVALAKMLLRPANFLVLDEPTNHLDIVSREVLEQALYEFKGTLAFVSHDRSFINALATRVIDVDHGKLREYLGNYDDYLERRRLESLGAAPTATAKPASPKSEPKEEARAADVPAASKAERARAREQRKAQERVQRQIARLEEEIHAREAEHEALGWKLGAPEIASDAERLQALQADRDALQSAIDDLYADWERLSDEAAALADAQT